MLVADIQLRAVQYTQIGKCMTVKWNKAKFITYYSLVQGIALTFKPSVTNASDPISKSKAADRMET